jgi:hypothetical protein
MPYKNQTKKNVAYIDVRFHLNKETEEWTNEDGILEESFTSLRLGKVERKKLKGITEEEADDLGESFAQMDSYQDFFVNSVPYVVSSGEEHNYRD